MEVVGKLLFIVILSAGTAYSVIHFVGDDFLSSGLDRNLLEESETVHDDIDLKQYRKKLRNEYYEHFVEEESDTDEKKQVKDSQIWNDTIKKYRE